MSVQTILRDLKTIKKLTTHRITADVTTTTTKTLPAVTVTCRSIRSRRFENATSLVPSLPKNQNFTYSFPDLVSVLESQRFNSKIISKLFNSTLKSYSNTGKFDAALETFDYMRNNGIAINERTCFGYLVELIKSEQLGLGLEVLYKMMEAGVHVSVYTLTVVVDGLCKIGEIKSGRELVQHAMCKNVKPNVVTFNTLIAACCRRWDFQELDLVMVLMEEGGVGFNSETYKFLIDGF